MIAKESGEKATPFGGVPAAFAAEAISDDAVPMTETIEDDAAPMASGHGHGIWCWVHWWILLGMLPTWFPFRALCVF